MLGTINVLLAARDAGADRVVFASSGGATFGDTEAMRVVGRGFAARVEPHPDGKLALADNKGLTQIVEHCPVGALTLRNAPVQTLNPVRTRPDE